MDKYAIRRAIISALYKFQNPQSFTTVLGDTAINLAVQKMTLTDEDIRDVRTEWHYLLGKGYLVAIPGYDDYCRLDGDLRSRIAARDPLSGLDPLRYDERLYGPAALRR